MKKPVAGGATLRMSKALHDSDNPHNPPSGVFSRDVFKTPPPTFDLEAYAKDSGTCTVIPPYPNKPEHASLRRLLAYKVRTAAEAVFPAAVLLPPTWEALPALMTHELASVFAHLDGKTSLEVLA